MKHALLTSLLFSTVLLAACTKPVEVIQPVIQPVIVPGPAGPQVTRLPLASRAKPARPAATPR